MKTLNVNGDSVEVEADDTTPLLWALREQLGLTGTKYGCGIAQCGSCTVHLDGVAVRSCVLPLAAVNENTKITTIEGLSDDGSHPVQQAWAELDVPQAATAARHDHGVAGMLNATPMLTMRNDSQITGCRCGTFSVCVKGSIWRKRLP